ncbi:MAG: hypothetical protein ACI8PZ_000004 [Myxococcota bacterium]
MSTDRLGELPGLPPSTAQNHASGTTKTATMEQRLNIARALISSPRASAFAVVDALPALTSPLTPPFDERMEAKAARHQYIGRVQAALRHRESHRGPALVAVLDGLYGDTRVSIRSALDVVGWAVRSSTSLTASSRWDLDTSAAGVPDLLLANAMEAVGFQAARSDRPELRALAIDAFTLALVLRPDGTGSWGTQATLANMLIENREDDAGLGAFDSLRDDPRFRADAHPTTVAYAATRCAEVLSAVRTGWCRSPVKSAAVEELLGLVVDPGELSLPGVVLESHLAYALRVRLLRSFMANVRCHTSIFEDLAAGEMNGFSEESRIRIQILHAYHRARLLLYAGDYAHCRQQIADAQQQVWGALELGPWLAAVLTAVMRAEDLEASGRHLSWDDRVLLARDAAAGRASTTNYNAEFLAGESRDATELSS